MILSSVGRTTGIANFGAELGTNPFSCDEEISDSCVFCSVLSTPQIDDFGDQLSVFLPIVRYSRVSGASQMNPSISLPLTLPR